MSWSLQNLGFSRVLRTLTSCGSARPLTFSYIKQHHVIHTKLRSASSSLFISNKHPDLPVNFQFDHGFRDRLTRKDELRRSLRLRDCQIDLDKLERDYKHYVELVARQNGLEKQRNEISKKMAELMRSSKKEKNVELTKALIAKGKQLKEEFKTQQAELWDFEEELMGNLLALPNNILADVTEKEETIAEYFQENKKNLNCSHLDLIASCPDIKLSGVGDRAYYLRGRLAELEQDLLDKFSTELRQCGFTTLLAPEMFKTPIIEGGGVDVTSPESVYRLSPKPVQRELTDWDPDHQFLRGVSHLSFLAFLARMVINKERLPGRLFTTGPSYTPACENSTESLPGLYQVTQSNKVSVCGFDATQEGCLGLMEEFTSCLTHFYTKLQLPYRLVSMPAQSLTVMEQNRIELQIWAPSLHKYVKMASLSMCGDYSSRRLMITCSDDYMSPSFSSTHVHMVHGDFADITRLIALLLEYGKIH